MTRRRKEKVVAFPLARRDGPLSRYVCATCGHRDDQHDARRRGYECAVEGCRCNWLRPAADPPVTELPPSPEELRAVAAFLRQTADELVSWQRPPAHFAFVVLLSRTSSAATWGPGGCSPGDEIDVTSQVHDELRFARLMRDWRAQQRRPPHERLYRKPEPDDYDSRRLRLRRLRLDQRMRAVEDQQYPHRCPSPACAKAFKTERGLQMHRRLCHWEGRRA